MVTAAYFLGGPRPLFILDDGYVFLISGASLLFEQTFKNIDDKFWKDAGCSSELDTVEQSSWVGSGSKSIFISTDLFKSDIP